MVKFLHTADWHLGIKYKHLGDKAQEARDIRLKTVKKVLELAKDNYVDFVLVAGDIFDSNQVDRSLITELSKIFSQIAPTSVYLLPGNHDPLTMDSLYHDPVWQTLDNLTIFSEPEPLMHGNVILYPCPVNQKQSREDPTQWIEAKSNNISIGVAHGNLQVGKIENNFPIDPQRTEKSGLDYLALGEWHSLFKQKDSKGITRTVYSGTPETTKFGEDTSGKTVIVKIDSPNAIPQITEIEVGNLSWEKHEIEINSLIDVNNMELNLKNVPQPQKNIISLKIRGVTDPKTISYLSSLEDRYHNHFMFFQLLMSELYLKPNLLELKALLPEGTVINQTFEALMALMKTQPEIQDYSDISSERTSEIFAQLRDKDIIEGLSPKVLNYAFILMYQMIKEASQ